MFQNPHTAHREFMRLGAETHFFPVNRGGWLHGSTLSAANISELRWRRVKSRNSPIGICERNVRAQVSRVAPGQFELAFGYSNLEPSDRGPGTCGYFCRLARHGKVKT